VHKKKIQKQKKEKKKEPENLPPTVPDEQDDPKKEEAPPVFDLGDNTFAKKGQGAAWSLNRSEGNTKYAKMADKNQKSVRGTKVKRAPTGVAGATGTDAVFKPVPSKDWSKRPSLLKKQSQIPPYPVQAKRDGIEGKVKLQVFIDKTGRVKKVRIISDPGGGLGAAAKKHMQKLKWQPAYNKNGKPVDTIIVYTYTFVLED
jgi:protein TonB